MDSKRNDIIRLLAGLTAAALLAALTGCAGQGSAPDSDALRIVCTSFPAYDWAKTLTQSNSDVEITYLLSSGVDMHNYRPTAKDMADIAACDLLIYVGGESETWVADAIADMDGKERICLCMLDEVGDAAREEEVKEGMMPEEEEEEDEDEGPAYDEHVWLSVNNATTICQSITKALCTLDPDHSEAYTADLGAYAQELMALDEAFLTLDADQETLVFCDRFPFRYFVEDYGFDYYAAFPGCSAETEASFETIVFLANKIDELGVKNVFILENSDDSIARTVIENTQTKDQGIVALNSLQSVSDQQIADGATYISLMMQNRDTLKEALH